MLRTRLLGHLAAVMVAALSVSGAAFGRGGGGGGHGGGGFGGGHGGGFHGGGFHGGWGGFSGGRSFAHSGGYVGSGARIGSSYHAITGGTRGAQLSGQAHHSAFLSKHNVTSAGTGRNMPNSLANGFAAKHGQHHQGQGGQGHGGQGHGNHGHGRHVVFFPFFGFFPYGLLWGYPYGYGYGYGGLFGYGNQYGYYYPAAYDASQAGARQPYDQLGEDAFRAGNYAEAVYNWRHALVDEPTNGVLAMMLSQALFAGGSYNESAGLAQMGMVLLPEDQWGVVVKNYRELYPNIQNYTDQLRRLEKARNEKQDDPALRFLLGYHYLYLGYPKEATRELNKAIELEPKDTFSQKLLSSITGKPVAPADASAPADGQAPTDSAAPAQTSAPAKAESTATAAAK